MPWPDTSNIAPCPHCDSKCHDLAVMTEKYCVSCRICGLEAPWVESRSDAVSLWNALTINVKQLAH